MRKYDHKKLEKKWQKEWEKKGLYRAEDASKKPKKYILDMYPYPSGAGLHVGHVEGYTATDILSRYLRMRGYNVLHPMGWDAFGLPAENYAIKTKIHPEKTTNAAIKNFKRQIKDLALSYDWKREIGSHTPEYYKWTQWFFLLLYKSGLAYRAKAKVNWCPSCQTVLANEQVVDGACERCGTTVIQKDLEQWFFRITKYAEDLIGGLDRIDWPESTKTAQRNWIGKSEGAEIDFPLAIGAEKKYTYVILHGWEGSPSAPRYQHWKAELEKAGHTVVIPALPNSADPSEEEQVSAALGAARYDENTVLFGHSLGAVVAMKVAEQLQKPIARLVLAGGFADKDFKDKSRPFNKKFTWKFDGAKIRKKVQTIQLLHDPRDYAVSDAQLERLEMLLGVKAILLDSEEPHFSGKKELPVLRWLRPTITVFTTRADTLFGATYLVLAPEHPWIQLALSEKGIVRNEEQIGRYIALSAKKTELERLTAEKEKTGVQLEGVEALNPVTGKMIPVYVADYVLVHYGTGAVMGVPAHDERDHAFATKYALPIVEVVKPSAGNPSEGCYSGEGTLVNSGEFNGMTTEEGEEAITQKYGMRKVTYKLRDWLISRQRYWGAPIPIIYCEKCGAQPVPEKDLPVKLPKDVDFIPHGESPLARSKSFHKVRCPKCKGSARRESDTMDTFVCSSWYFFRFADPQNKKVFASKKLMQKWLPVDLYVGGAEHTVLHLLYSRFFTKVLKELGYITFDEPFSALRHQGTILAEDGKKMSKSLGNVINPDDVVKMYGADSTRLYEMFMGPLEIMKPWNTASIIGVRRFLEKAWRIQYGDFVNPNLDLRNPNIEPLLHKTIKKVGEDIEALKFNTAISALMIFLNAVEKEKSIGKRQWQSFLKILAPLAPHIAEELWKETNGKKSIHLEKWPSYDESKLKDETIRIAVQINGKTRADAEIAADADKSTQEEAARAAAGERLEGKNIIRTIVVPARLVNFVVE